uniref:Putative secreted protein n=1 Tax=Anopheles marajoara TaxID=58244 RepID=A0A2M4C9W8_9DIPT
MLVPGLPPSLPLPPLLLLLLRLIRLILAPDIPSGWCRDWSCFGRSSNIVAAVACDGLLLAKVYLSISFGSCSDTTRGDAPTLSASAQLSS